MRNTMNIKSIGAVILVASIAGNVYSAEGGDVYLGIGVGVATISESSFPDFEPTALVVRYGNFATDNFAAELRLGTGLSDDTQDSGGGDGTLEIDHILGVYGSYYLGTSSSTARVYGILGATLVEFTATVPGFVPVSEDDSDMSWGRG